MMAVLFLSTSTFRFHFINYSGTTASTISLPCVMSIGAEAADLSVAVAVSEVTL